MSDSHTKAADRPELETEIEITPAMIDAGIDEMEKYYLGDSRYAVEEDGFVAIFRAMWKARTL
ncbi:MAG: hypothetical protein ABSD21_02885 [Rhizomicrobium sp.]|jgi:hypothetical protein